MPSIAPSRDLDYRVMKQIRVAVGVVENTHGQILICKRQAGQHLAGLWEFPGGKIEPEESGDQALVRELNEEVAIEAFAPEYLFTINHTYPEKQVSLLIYRVTGFNGEAAGVEGQELKWVKKPELVSYEFPEANKAILDYLLAQN